VDEVDAISDSKVYNLKMRAGLFRLAILAALIVVFDCRIVYSEDVPFKQVVPPTYSGVVSSPMVKTEAEEPAPVLPSDTPGSERANFDDLIESGRRAVVDAFNSPEGQATAKATSIISLIIGAFISIRQLFATPIALSEIFLLPTRLWGLFAVAVGLRKRLVPWGTVYDSVTKQPIDPAIVVIKDRDGKTQEAVTDIDGRYGFLAEPGEYELTVAKTHYVFPSEKLRGKHEDVIYEDLYFGGPIIVRENEPIIKRDVPLDAVDFDWNEFQKQQKRMAIFARRAFLFLFLSDTVFYIGLVVSILAILITGSLFNIITGFVYAFVLALRLFGRDPRAFGTISHKDGNGPASFAVLKVFSGDRFARISERVADKYGRYFCLVPGGNRFAITIDEKKEDGTYRRALERITEAPMGIIKKNFKI
jgi:hypothetical protein